MFLRQKNILSKNSHLHAHRLIQCKYNRSSYRNCPRDPYHLVQVNTRSEGVATLLECALGTLQPRIQALSTTRLVGGKNLVQAGHVSPRFWEITIGTYCMGVGMANVAFDFAAVQNNTRSVNIKATQRTIYHETKFLLACIFHKISKGRSC